MIEAEGSLTSASNPMNAPFDGNNSEPFYLAWRDGLPVGVQTIDSSSNLAYLAIPPERRMKKSIDSQNT